MNVAALRHSERASDNRHHTSLLDDHRVVEPPESLPNSEVKRNIADGSVGIPHVRVGHRQASKHKRLYRTVGPFLLAYEKSKSKAKAKAKAKAKHTSSDT